LRVGGRQIDDAVAEAFLAELTPAGLEAALRAAEQLESDHDSVLAQFRREVERAEYEAQRASGAIAQSMLKTGWSREVSKPTGNRVCTNWKPPVRN